MTRRDILHTPDQASLKIAASELIDAVGGSSKAAGYCRADQRRLSEYAAPNTDTFMPSDVKVALEKRAAGTVGFPQVTREEARQLGFVLVKVPEASASDGDVLRQLGVMTQNFGGSSATILAAIADGKIDDDECDQVDQAITALIEAAVATQAVVRSVRGAG